MRINKVKAHLCDLVLLAEAVVDDLPEALELLQALLLLHPLQLRLQERDTRARLRLPQGTESQGHFYILPLNTGLSVV